MERVRVALASNEYAGLVSLCETELRSVSDELRHLLRRELSERGLWPVRSIESQESAEVPTDEQR